MRLIYATIQHFNQNIWVLMEIYHQLLLFSHTFEELLCEGVMVVEE